MKKKILVATFLMFISVSIFAQENTQKKKHYRTWISQNKKLKTVHGLLYEIKDSTLFVSDYLNDSNQFSVMSEPTRIDYRNIEFIKIRREYNVGKGILFGAATGFVIGGLIGSTSDSGMYAIQPTSRDKAQMAVILGSGLAIPGALIGGLIGSFKIVIPINGNILKFNQNKERLKNYSFRK